MSDSISQSTKLERLEAFEERLGVRLDALYAKIDGSRVYQTHNREFPSIRVTGEIHPANGTALPQRIKIVADAYNAQGQVVDTSERRCLDPEEFFGYETFELHIGGTHPSLIKKIRIYPKASLY